jgi:hypothetical protein
MRKKLAIINGSSINASLIPILFQRVIPPGLNLISGIIKKKWDIFIEEIQLVESKVVIKQKQLQEGYANLLEYISSCEAVVESNEQDVYSAQLEISKCKVKRVDALKHWHRGDGSLEL